MPPSAQLDKRTRVKVGDIVSVAVGAFGQEYAESRGARPWNGESVRDEGTITDRGDNGTWSVTFADSVHNFKRSALSFVRHSEEVAQGSRRSAAVAAADSEESDVEAPVQYWLYIASKSTHFTSS